MKLEEMNFIQLIGYTITWIFVAAILYGIYYIIKKKIEKAKEKLIEEIKTKTVDKNTPE